jgi:hypothetical protein
MRDVQQQPSVRRGFIRLIHLFNTCTLSTPALSANPIQQDRDRWHVLLHRGGNKKPAAIAVNVISMRPA